MFCFKQYAWVLITWRDSLKWMIGNIQGIRAIIREPTVPLHSSSPSWSSSWPYWCQLYVDQWIILKGSKLNITDRLDLESYSMKISTMPYCVKVFILIISNYSLLVHILWEPKHGLLYFQMISSTKKIDLRGHLVEETSVDQLLEEELHITKLWILVMK